MNSVLVAPFLIQVELSYGDWGLTDMIVEVNAHEYLHAGCSSTLIEAKKVYWLTDDRVC